ncbi:zinc carboxypeptidase A 1 precursor [Cordyceps militaris CM01]|uniref:Zinc carboxypeptidase A 1 n=1 Tax=Cordyceps militaris (strain CM01) TaxID=983644 RepID=G3JNG3_CORMM|nr:zinc carboxypeptidase A 1 precursor [Cordyceps militaris CM01]EGX89982.1 zinc carboxypeptidase A 1 precursor [Cordyceps militaris CM01]
MKPQSMLPVAAALFLAAHGCLLPEEIEAERHLAWHGQYPDTLLRLRQRQAVAKDTGMPVGTGDRFAHGTVAPRGLATADRDMRTLLTPAEVTSGLRALARHYRDVRFFDAPHPTHENRTVSGIVIGAAAPRVYLEAGIHARERGGPDHMLYFLADLLHARETGAGVRYGARTYTPEQVRAALSAGIVSMPMVNPDGVAYDQETGSCWRKNRNDGSATLTPAGAVGVGVDLNRNFDALWDYHKYFDPAIPPPASTMPASESFRGTAPFSEPESRNAAWIAQQHPSLTWFLDLHSIAGDVLYAWGDDNPQTTDPSQSFTNPAWDGKRGVIGDGPTGAVYKEYMEAADLQAQRDTAAAMAAAMNAAGDGTTVHFVPLEEASLYATSGGSTDWFLGRYYGHTCGSNRINGLAIEFGSDSGLDCPFYPTNPQFHNSMRQVAAGLMEIVLAAAGKNGEPKIWKC